jgi:hypothetical protein
MKRSHGDKLHGTKKEIVKVGCVKINAQVMELARSMTIADVTLA